MQIHPQPSEFRNLMIRPNPGAFYPPCFFNLWLFSHFLSLFPISPHHLFPQLCNWFCHLVLMPRRWTQLWFATVGLRVQAWHHGCWFQNNLHCAAVTHFASDGHRDHSSMCLQLSVVLSKNCNLQRQAWRCTSAEQRKLKVERCMWGSCGETNKSLSRFLIYAFLWHIL